MCRRHNVGSRVGLKTIVGKIKVLVVKKDQRGSCEKARLSGEEIVEVSKVHGGDDKNGW